MPRWTARAHVSHVNGVAKDVESMLSQNKHDTRAVQSAHAYSAEDTFAPTELLAAAPPASACAPGPAPGPGGGSSDVKRSLGCGFECHVSKLSERERRMVCASLRGVHDVGEGKTGVMTRGCEKGVR